MSAVARGATHASHGSAREGQPWTSCEHAGRAQQMAGSGPTRCLQSQHRPGEYVALHFARASVDGGRSRIEVSRH
jgi:hypothetical protein